MKNVLRNQDLITLRLIGECSLDQQKEILNIRNQLSVRTSMYSDHLISLEEHLNWINSLVSNKKNIVFIVLNSIKKPLGLVSLQNYEAAHKKSSWAFYLDENVRGGLGAFLEFNFLDFAFINLDLEKLNCEVIDSNEAVIKLHKKFYFSEEGHKRSEIVKDGVRVGTILLGILKHEWLSKRVIFLNKYGAIFSRYAITIEMEGWGSNGI